MKTIKTCVTALISALLVFSPVAYADKWSDQFPHIKATGDIPGDCSYESMSKKNYKGKTLKINTHAVPVMGEPTALHAEQFANLLEQKLMLLIHQQVTYMRKQWYHFKLDKLHMTSFLDFQTSLTIGEDT